MPTEVDASPFAVLFVPHSVEPTPVPSLQGGVGSACAGVDNNAKAANVKADAVLSLTIFFIANLHFSLNSPDAQA